MAALIACATTAVAAPASTDPTPTLVLTDRDALYQLKPYLSGYIDATREATLDDILSPDFAGAFVPVDELKPQGDPAPVWLRLRVTDETSSAVQWLLSYENYRINDLDVHTPIGSTYRSVATGNRHPYSSRDVENRLYVFRVSPDPGPPETIYLRLYDSSSFVPLTPLSIQSAENLMRSTQTDYFWSGVFYAVALTALFYSVLFMTSLRDQLTVSFALFILSVVFLTTSADGLGHQFLWPEAPEFAEASMLLSVLVFVAALLHFTVAALNVRTHHPAWARGAGILVIVLLVISVVRLVFGVESTLLAWVGSACLLAGLVLPVVLAIMMLRRERGPAITYLVGFSAYLAILVGALVTTVQAGGSPSEHLSRIAFVWLLAVFSVVVQQRVSAVRREREIAAKRLLKQQEQALLAKTEVAQVLATSRDDLLKAYDTTLEGWARLLETRDKETEGHCRNVTDLTVRFAEALGVEHEQLLDIRRGALLHDIGKIAVPDSILLKPGPLDDDEWETMRQHPLYAKSALEGIPFLEDAAVIPTHHHERWDGSGYPFGLAGEQIPYAARIFAIVDNWDALTSDRPYRKAWPAEKVARHLTENAGVMFDPEMVPVFVGLVRASDEGDTA
ncbi:MAG: 7TM diverse intracellular signaling domain-containing protein [Coriobacteriia bacterium]|nr:7TM diverse intracellular signaling domain-containing protein [Coriobacteriia bacterium]